MKFQNGYLDRCINCGFCEAVCPTLEAFEFNAFYGARGRVNLAKYYFSNSLKEGDVSDSFNSCLHCNACLQVCPAGISAGEISGWAKMSMVKRDHITHLLMKNIIEYKDPVNIGNKASEWAKGLTFDEKSEYLLYTGRMFQLMPYNNAIEKIRGKIGHNLFENVGLIASHLPKISILLEPFVNKEDVRRYNRILVNIYKLLSSSDIHFYYLGEDEPYSGAMLLEFGLEDEFIQYAIHLKEFFLKYNFSKIITVDPHTYTLLKYQIKDYIDFPFEVFFYLDFVSIKSKGFRNITIHQACHLERYGEKYRKYFSILSGEMINLPKNNNERTYCCGGPDEVEYPEIAARISDKRFEELKETGADFIITMCPICLLNLSKDESVLDISEFMMK